MRFLNRRFLHRQRSGDLTGGAESLGTLSAPDGRTWTAETTNVNEGGLHAAVTAPMPETGALVAASFEVSGQRRTLHARVVESIETVEAQWSSEARLAEAALF